MSKESGILNLPNETSNPVVADHHTVCKFKGANDPRYKDVRNLILSLVGPLHDAGEWIHPGDFFSAMSSSH